MTRVRRSGPGSDGPCRHRCRHYDCMMDRGERLPEGVTGYVEGVLYQPTDLGSSVVAASDVGPAVDLADPAVDPLDPGVVE